VSGLQTPFGILPTEDELSTVGLEIEQADLDELLSLDIDRWRQEIGFRQAHLEQFAGLPEEIWTAHRRVAQALEDEALGD
jgi:phosphoenolpyruvate carboxykinase (GTP)